MSPLLLLVLSLACLLQASVATNELVLTLVPNNDGAVCLDGTPPGYYWRAAQNSASTNRWIISIFGGGWCYNEQDCYGRSKTKLGSSKYWDKILNGTGIVSGNPSVNPDFWGWNVAYLIYCDGASFSGNKDKPIVVNGTTLYFRGRRILDSVLDDLNQKGLNKATHVILTGCSAGGLSTFLHSNYIASVLPSTAVFKSIPQSGFFLDTNNLDSQPVYPDEMKYVYNMQNCSEGVDTNCSLHTDSSKQWQCIFGPSVYPYISVPIFILNSYYDSWQMSNILGAQVASFKTCASKGPESCTVEQIRHANAFHHSFLELVEGSSTFHSANNGVFLHSCWTHCASSSDSHWTGLKVGGVTMSKAVGDWFFDRTSNNNHIDCTMKTTKPYRCNPTCPS